MKKILFILVLVGCGMLAKAQNNPFPTTDSLERFINRWIRNSAVEAFQNLRLNTAMIGMVRFIQNSEIGSGVDTMYKLNDSTVRLITHAPDTFDVTLRFAGGGGPNSNVGAGFRWAVVGTQNIKTLVTGYGLVADSTTNADAITIRADTSGTNGLVTRTELLDSTDITTQVEDPIYVKEGATWSTPDTLAFDMDTVFSILTRGIVVVDTIQFIHSGNSVTTYQNDKLIGSKLLHLSIESYPVGFLTRSNSVYMTFNPSTGTITLTNGRLYDDDMVYILYRTGAIFVTDGDGNLITDSNGNYVIEN